MYTLHLDARLPVPRTPPYPKQNAASPKPKRLSNHGKRKQREDYDQLGIVTIDRVLARRMREKELLPRLPEASSSDTPFVSYINYG